MSVLSAQIRIQRDLTEILTLSAELSEQAISQARDRLMPGGAAMVALAPVASPETFANLIDGAERKAIRVADQYGLDVGDLMPGDTVELDEGEPPLQLLRFWSEPIRVEHNLDYGARATIESEAKLLRWAITNAATGTHDMGRLAADVNLARLRLENILHAGHRPERVRVVCDRDFCETNPTLVRVRDRRTVAAWRCRACGCGWPFELDLEHCPNPWCWSPVHPQAIWVSDSERDRFKCPACKTRYDTDAMKRAHAKQLRSQGAERYVSLIEAIATLKAQGRGERTVRRWLAPSAQGEPVEAFCDLSTHVVYVWWPDLWRLHNTVRITPRRVSRDNVGAA